MSNFEINYVNDTQDLNEKTYLLYAAKHYDNANCHDIEEFYNDLQIPMHLKKLFTRYNTKGVIKERLIINHVVSFFNVFDPFAAAKLLFYKIDEKDHVLLKTVLVFLNRCPTFLLIEGQILDTTKIEIDPLLYSRLERI